MDEGPLQLVSDSQRENEASENKAWGPVPGMYETCDGKPLVYKKYFSVLKCLYYIIEKQKL